MGTSAPWRPALVGASLGVVGLVWAAWRRRRFGLPGLEPRRPLGVAVVVVAALAVGVFAGPSVLAGADRAVLRSTVTPPFDPQAYPSPLAGYRKYVKAERTTVLFDVTGLPSGARIRLAALDDYDGILLGTSADTGTFARVGDRVASVPDGTAANLTVAVKGYSDVWLPTAGYLAGIDFTGPGRRAAHQRLPLRPQHRHRSGHLRADVGGRIRRRGVPASGSDRRADGRRVGGGGGPTATAGCARRDQVQGPAVRAGGRRSLPGGHGPGDRPAQCRLLLARQ